MDLKTLVIYGSSSFTGRAIANLASQSNIKLIGVSRSSYLGYPNEILVTNDEFITMAIPKDSVGIYLAAPLGTFGPEDVESAANIMIVRFIKFLEKAKNSNFQKVIYASSYWQFADNGDLAPRSKLYISFKNSMDEIAFHYSRSLNIVSLVLFDSYGPKDNRNKIWNLISNSVKNSKTLDLSAGEQIIYPIYSSDLAAAFVVAANHTYIDGFRRFWVPGPQRLSLKEAVHLYCFIKKIEPKINWGTLPYSADQIFEPYVGEKIPKWSAKISPSVGFALI